MTTYLQKGQSSERRLQPGESLELRFDPGGQGLVRMNALVLPSLGAAKPGEPARPRPSPTQLKLELLRSGIDQPLTQHTQTGAAAELTHILSAGAAAGGLRWSFRLTNLGERAADVRASVVHPTDVELTTSDISLVAFHQLTRGTIRALALHLESGDERCWIDLTDPQIREFFALNEIELPLPARFTIPAVPVWDAVGSREDPLAFVHDVNASSIELTAEPASVRFPAGALHLALKFEEKGIEIVVERFHDVELSNMNLDLRLALAARDGLVSWDRVDVDFPVSADIRRFPDWLISPIINVTKAVRYGVEGALEKMLESPKSRWAISTAITRVIKFITGIPPEARIVAVRVTQERLVLTYYEDRE